MDTQARAVLSPEIVGRSLFDPECARVLAAWRDGRFTVVSSRASLKRTLALLSSLGLGEPLLAEWATWFARGEHSNFVAAEASEGDPCETLLWGQHAAWIVSLRPGPQRITPREWLRQLEANDRM